MRLLNVESLSFTEFRGVRPPYAIASHRWLPHSETTFREVQHGRSIDSPGYRKVTDFAKYIRSYIPSIQWLWIDTCCIDRSSVAELNEAVNSMFAWYRDSEVCLAYLADVADAPAVGGRNIAFEYSDWFKRGWTLQELLAPSTVVFLTKTWQVIGNKGGSHHGYNRSFAGSGLESDIATITGIPVEVLFEGRASERYSVDEKMKWMEGRATTREEDSVYALYGFFDVQPGINYGEGRSRARQRLVASIHHKDYLRKITDWLDPADPWTNHEWARQQCEPKTGAWLLASEQYRGWKADGTHHLWIHGKPGCGKTVLCSTAIDDVRTYRDGEFNITLATFYFSFADQRKQAYNDLLRSLISQLALKGPALSMLSQAFKKPDRSRPSTEEMERIFSAAVEPFNKVFLMLDALDESPNDSATRQTLLDGVERLVRNSSKVKIFATSRDLPDIRGSMEAIRAATLSIDMSAVDVDIKKYVTSQLSANKRFRGLELRTSLLIVNTISSVSNGMFRWASCQIAELKKLKSFEPSSVRATLHNLPTSLDETYERILMRIVQRDRKKARTQLQWLVYALSPLSLAQLTAATTVNDTASSSEIDSYDLETLDCTSCIPSGLDALLQFETKKTDEDDEDHRSCRDSDATDAVVDETPLSLDRPRRPFRSCETQIRLAHFSIKDYLESVRILHSHARDFFLESEIGHRRLAQSCLTYITRHSCDARRSATRKHFVKYPLLEYAAKSWYHHSSLQECDDVSLEVNLLSSENLKLNWLAIHQPDKLYEPPFQPLNNIGSGLYYASYTGLGRVAQSLLNAGADANAQGGQFGNALQASSLGGHKEVVSILLDAGADINAQGGYYDCALQAASSGGHDDIVRLLLDAGADVNAQGGYHSNALQAASSGGHDDIVRLLLDVGADVNAQGGHFGTALQAASIGNHDQTGDTWRDDVSAGDALQTLSIEGQKRILQILLDAGANVNAQGGYYGNALQAASWSGRKEIVQMLLDAGANVNAFGGKFATALEAAVTGRHTAIARLLLETHADVDALDRFEDYGGDADEISSVASIESKMDSIWSSEQSSSSKSSIRDDLAGPVDLFVDILLQEKDLSTLLQAAVQIMSCDRFIRNHRRLLKEFYLALRSQAQSELERAALELVKHRKTREAISQKVFGSLTSAGVFHELQVRAQNQSNVNMIERMLQQSRDIAEPPPDMSSGSKEGQARVKDVRSRILLRIQTAAALLEVQRDKRKRLAPNDPQTKRAS